MPPPPGNHHLYPKAALDGAGRLHAVWGTSPEIELPTMKTRVEGILHPDLFYAVHDPDHGWGSRVQLALPKGSRVPWTPGESGASFYVDDAGRAHLTTLGTDSTRRVLMQHHVMADGVVSSHRLEQSRLTIHLPAVGSGERVYQVQTGRSPEHIPPAGGWSYTNLHPFVRESRDGGATWEEPRPVGDVVEGKISPMRAHLGPGGDLFLIAGQGVSADSDRDIVRLIQVSAIDGEWVEHEPHDPAHHFFQLASTIDRCGGVHVVYRELRPDGTKPIVYLSHREGAWTESSEPFSFEADALELHANGEGLLLVGLRETIRDEMPRLLEEPIVVKRPYR